MKKFFSVFIGLALITIGHYIYRQWPENRHLESDVEKAGILWPEGTEFEVNEQGEVVFILSEEMSFREGIWPEGSRVYFDEDEIKGMEVFQNFEFAQFEFYQAAKIAFVKEDSQSAHVIELTEKAEFDGLPLKPGCLIKFKNYVLDKASCEEFENVHFKRKLEMPEVKKTSGPKK